MAINILITSAGGLTGTYLIRHLKSQKQLDLRIITIDNNDKIPAKVFSDKFYKVPKLYDSVQYMKEILEIVAKESIDVLIPTASWDVDFYAENGFLQEVKMLLPNDVTNRLLSNKDTCYRYLNELGIQTPKIIEDRTQISEDFYPLLLKPRKSSGSKGVQKISNEFDLNYWSNICPDALLMNYIDGEEYTVDCLFDSKGNCVGYNNRLRKKTISGGAVETVSVYDPKVGEIIEKLEHNRNLSGPINFQYRLNAGCYIVFDFNTRFASGGLPLTVQCGFDIPMRLLELILYGRTAKYEQSAKTNGLTMIRYYNELFYENE